MQKRILTNNQIRVAKVRLIDETGAQLGVLDTYQALQKAREKGLDLIQVTEKTEPPVCKIGDFGKYLYHERKKEKPSKRIGELKSVRLSFGISDHDLEIRARAAEKFLKEGHKVRVEMVLRGREKYLGNFSREKMNKFLEKLKELVPFKMEREVKKEFKGLTTILTKE